MQASKLALCDDLYRTVYACGLDLLTCKFTITHPSVMAVITVTHVYVPLSSTRLGN